MYGDALKEEMHEENTAPWHQNSVCGPKACLKGHSRMPKRGGRSGTGVGWWWLVQWYHTCWACGRPWAQFPQGPLQRRRTEKMRKWAGFRSIHETPKRREPACMGIYEEVHGKDELKESGQDSAPYMRHPKGESLHVWAFMRRCTEKMS